MSDASSPAIRLEIRAHVAHLTMTRADAANTMNLQFGREFAAAAYAIRKDSSVRAVLLRGEGKNFCFGGDLRGMMAAGGDVNAYLSELTTDVHAGLIHLARANAPVVAAVQGSAAGAGLGLVLAADLAIAGRSAKFTAAYTAVGLTPDAGSTFLLPRAVGYKRAMEMLISNRVLDAQLALEWGLINQIVEDAQLADTAAALAARLAAGATGAFGTVKRLLAESEPGWEAQLAREGSTIAGRAATAEGREGIAAFLEKRTPNFS
jgi:2-(1,2-epoxy-1,2-dihydrophenyl)acetyl-CoA isomerase